MLPHTQSHTHRQPEGTFHQTDRHPHVHRIEIIHSPTPVAQAICCPIPSSTAFSKPCIYQPHAFAILKGIESHCDHTGSCSLIQGTIDMRNMPRPISVNLEDSAQKRGLDRELETVYQVTTNTTIPYQAERLTH